MPSHHAIRDIPRTYLSSNWTFGPPPLTLPTPHCPPLASLCLLVWFLLIPHVHEIIWYCLSLSETLTFEN